MSRDVTSLSSYLQEVCEQPSLGRPPLNINLLEHRKGAERCANVLETRQSDWSVSTPKQMIGWQFACVRHAAEKQQSV